MTSLSINVVDVKEERRGKYCYSILVKLYCDTSYALLLGPLICVDV